MKLSKIKLNPDNPRVIKDARFKKLMQSIKDFPKMFKYRPLVVDDNFMVLGGNQRLKALKQLGYDEIPNDWVKKASDLTEEEQQEFIIKDNVSFGEDDWAKLEEDWNAEDLERWGLDVPEKKEEIEPGEIVFSEYLDESQNYVVLTFSNDIDWLNAQTHFDLKTVHSKRANGKPWSAGIGRVLDGAAYLKKLKDV